MERMITSMRTPNDYITIILIILILRLPSHSSSSSSSNGISTWTVNIGPSHILHKPKLVSRSGISSEISICFWAIATNYGSCIHNGTPEWMISLYSTWTRSICLVRIRMKKIHLNNKNNTENVGKRKNYLLFSALEEGVEFNGHFTAQCLS